MPAAYGFTAYGDPVHPRAVTDVTGPHPLDNPVRSSLAGPHARFAERRGNVLRYPVDVSPFVALPDQPDAADWADVAALAGPGALVALAGVRVPAPAGWEVTLLGEGIQFVDRKLQAEADGEAVRLGRTIGLYEDLGFRLRRGTVFSAARVPAAARVPPPPAYQPADAYRPADAYQPADRRIPPGSVSRTKVCGTGSA